ncbi:hypothetical protein [Actinomyces minihominis]|uniref:hypothetical protein n=1 Tax=Actinomyces minihominis TaxID=2002838 RepID=UPI000C079730|nr:hypothetical protein [Actinomyces minihominis]
MDPNYPSPEDLTFGEGPLGEVAPAIAVGPKRKYPHLKFQGPGLRTRIEDPAGYISLVWSTEQGAYDTYWVAEDFPLNWVERQRAQNSAIIEIGQALQDGEAVQEAVDDWLKDRDHTPIEAVDLEEYGAERERLAFSAPPEAPL